ncbi:MAG TPA: hypothetical protein VLO07_04300 [Thermoanaerobaculia bacterium]|nr:hypothetical protein [Thermoanaerobaculia bacterium]
MKKTLVLVASSSLFMTLAALRGTAAAPLLLPLKVEKLSAPEGTTLPSYDTLELRAVEGGRYDVRLAPGENAPRLSGVDLGLLVPRVPRLARGNEALTRLALIQREFNRNEVHNPMPDGVDFSIANNCLERGLWEVKIARQDAGKTVTVFHAWFTLPKEEYARLFREVNGGLDEARFDGLFSSYPGVGGFVLPLEELRGVKSERELAPLEIHAADPLDRLTEQKNKMKLLRTAGITTFGNFARPANQPVMLAKFNVPGMYDPADSMRFDLTWLARPARIVWREVEGARAPGVFPEVEVRFENGYRILAADARLADLPVRHLVPAVEADVLKLVCGIGTPTIHATAGERAAELSEDRPRYLMILDAKGNHVDNHLTGVDGLYAWREDGDPGQLHLWLVGYERIALVAHLSTRWPPAS